MFGQHFSVIIVDVCYTEYSLKVENDKMAAARTNLITSKSNIKEKLHKLQFRINTYTKKSCSVVQKNYK